MRGATSGDPQSIAVALRALEKLAKLAGVDAPIRLDVAGKNGGPLTIEVFRKLTNGAQAQLDKWKKEGDKKDNDG
jgi:hypothetical protein